MTQPPGESEALNRSREAQDLAEQGPVSLAVTVVAIGFTFCLGILNWASEISPLVPWVVCGAYLLNLAQYLLQRDYLSLSIATAFITLVGCVVIQYWAGGVLASGANGMWAIGAALMSSVLLSGRYVRLGMTAFVVAVVGGLVLELVVPPPLTQRPEWLKATIAVTNILLLGLLATFSLAVFIRQRDAARTALAVENRRSEELLERILPVQVVGRLKAKQGTIADRLEATILFADLVGFTPLSRKESPERVVELLDALFSEFDVVVERYGLEKIKTMGDAYMAAGGVPEPRADHARAVASLALELREVTQRFRDKRGVDLRVRIGVHTGPVVAGVIGRKRFTYDMWGDTVNLASRMESHGEPDEIQVSEAVQKLLEDEFDFEPRGLVNVKGIGELKTWLLRGRRVTPPTRAG